MLKQYVLWLLMFNLFKEPSVPMLAKVILNAELSRVQWNHRTSGDCYTECSFHFDVRVYSTDQPDYSRSLSVSTLYVNLTNLSVNASYRMEIKAVCSQHDAQSEPLSLDFAIKGRLLFQVSILIILSIVHVHMQLHSVLTTCNFSVYTYNI